MREFILLSTESDGYATFTDPNGQSSLMLDVTRFNGFAVQASAGVQVEVSLDGSNFTVIGMTDPTGTGETFIETASNQIGIAPLSYRWLKIGATAALTGVLALSQRFSGVVLNQIQPA